jgi:RNA polymerase sigma-70 factor (ECF subfamily)
VRDLLAEHVPSVYRFALRLTNDRHAAEDLTQETLLRAWKRRELLREPRALRVWLFRIAANLWRDQLRRRQSPIARAEPLGDDAAPGQPAPEERLADQDDLRRALDAMAALPPRQREVLYLSACEGLSANEIAIALSATVGSVKVNLCLARRKLRELLKDLVEDLFLLL